MKYHVTLTLEVPSAVSRNAAIASAKMVCLSRRGGEFLIATTASEVNEEGRMKKAETKPAHWRKRTTK